MARWIDRLLDFAFPRQCRLCQPVRDEGTWLCAACGSALPPAPPGRTPGGIVVAACTTYLPHEGPAGRLVRALKYEQARDLAGPLGRLMAARWPWVGEDVLLLPVPLHRHRLLARGYNQAVLLTSALARPRGMAWAREALARVRDTGTQTRLPAAERRRNPIGAFRVRQPALVRGRDVVLIDDVVTTGATADACAAALREAHVRRVRVYAFARTPASAVVDAPGDSLKSGA